MTPLSDYLGTSYRPDCDYLEGELLERNVGEWDHSRLQLLLSADLSSREAQFGILVVLEQRVQVKARRFRIPDITVVLGSRPEGGIITTPPFLCVEILSPSDRVPEMQERIGDYLAFGTELRLAGESPQPPGFYSHSAGRAGNHGRCTEHSES